MIKNFLKNLKALFEGMFTVFKHSFKRRVTLEYPEKKNPLSENFRGLHDWNFDKCVGCKICERVCPSNAISINKNDEKITFSVDLSRCIFCGNCSYYCRQGALKLSGKFELASKNKEDLIIKSGNVDSNDDNNEVVNHD